MSLFQIQSELKAPKNQFNKFGGYKYRSCEDIMEALKPVLLKHEANCFISDEVVLIGERYYLKATVTLTLKDATCYKTTAFAREEETKKGMDASQITGSASSYARKYALNAMFSIDDTADADATNTHDKEAKKSSNHSEKVLEIEELILKSGTDKDKFLAYFQVDSIEKLPYEKAIQSLNVKIEKEKQKNLEAS